MKLSNDLIFKKGTKFWLVKTRGVGNSYCLVFNMPNLSHHKIEEAIFLSSLEIGYINFDENKILIVTGADRQWSKNEYEYVEDKYIVYENTPQLIEEATKMLNQYEILEDLNFI